MRRQYIPSASQQAEQFRARAAFGFLCVALALFGLGGWYFKLQIVDHQDYAKKSQQNRVKQRPEVPARGLIYDRKGRVLADNVPAYRLDIVPSEAGDIDTLLASLSKIIALTPEDIERFNDTRHVTRSFLPVTLRLRITDEEAARFAVDRWRYPGVELVPYLTRRYPYGDLFAHVIGYVGRVDKNDLQKLGEGSSAFTHTGKAGLERYYDQTLRGQIGFEQIETNVDGRIIGTVGRIPATPGADLRLSIDAELQRVATYAFGDLTGSAVAIDPRTGEILAMVSVPSYDPNLFVNGISHADYRTLMDDPAKPLFNRNVLGGVAPGSTLKPLFALAALDSGKRTPDFKIFASGEFRIPGQKRGYRDAHSGEGWTDMRKSIGDSVNTYYYKLSLDMGIDLMDQYMATYGFGQPTGIDLSGESGGILPSPEWKRTHAKSQGPWYLGDTVISSIGQGYWKVTPLQLVQAVGALANGGLLRRPHLVKETRDDFDKPWTMVPQPAPKPVTRSAEHLQVVREGMIRTVHGPGGTARNISVGLTYQIASKTGTAQVVSRRGNVGFNPRSLPMHLRHRALFEAYAPADNPTIAIAVVVEGGGFGADTAAPIARKMFDAWLLGKLPEGLEAAPGVTPAAAPAQGAPAQPRVAAAPAQSPVSAAPALTRATPASAPATPAPAPAATAPATPAPATPASPKAVRR